MSVLEDFFQAIDRAWSAAAHPRVKLSLIGSGALMLQANYERGTKDSDVLETSELSVAIKAQLAAIAGPGTPIAQQWRLYLDVVRNGIPFLPVAPRWHPVPALNAQLDRLELYVLDVVDVVVSKLKRYSASDQDDIDAMIQRDLVPHEMLLERFRSAVDAISYDARAEDLPKYVGYLHRVERDMLDVAETEIELPGWI